MCYLMGDFKMNLINSKSDKITAELIDTKQSFYFVPLINKSTRVAKKTAMIIDKIFTNDLHQIENNITGLLYTDISDHFPIFHVFKINTCSSENENKTPKFSQRGFLMVKTKKSLMI